jgi:hypothetical protein
MQPADVFQFLCSNSGRVKICCNPYCVLNHSVNLRNSLRKTFVSQTGSVCAAAVEPPFQQRHVTTNLFDYYWLLLFCSRELHKLFLLTIRIFATHLSQVSLRNAPLHGYFDCSDKACCFSFAKLVKTNKYIGLITFLGYKHMLKGLD